LPEFGDSVRVLPGIYRLELVEVTGDAAIILRDVQTRPCSATQIDVSVAS
jgi:hypothetical protein